MKRFTQNSAWRIEWELSWFAQCAEWRAEDRAKRRAALLALSAERRARVLTQIAERDAELLALDAQRRAKVLAELLAEEHVREDVEECVDLYAKLHAHLRALDEQLGEQYWMTVERAQALAKTARERTLDIGTLSDMERQMLRAALLESAFDEYTDMVKAYHEHVTLYPHHAGGFDPRDEWHAVWDDAGLVDDLLNTNTRETPRPRRHPSRARRQGTRR